MARTYRCPRCREETDPGAAICSNAACRAELAFCSQCRDVTTYRPLAGGPASPSSGSDGSAPRVEAPPSAARRSGGGLFARWRRGTFVCERCERPGVKCRSWLMGGYCNGLARAGEGWRNQLCARCSHAVASAGKNVATAALIGGLGGLLRRRK